MSEEIAAMRLKYREWVYFTATSEMSKFKRHPFVEWIAMQNYSPDFLYEIIKHSNWTFSGELKSLLNKQLIAFWTEE